MQGTPPLPKFYVLTIPGSPRHAEARRQLNLLGVEYEFVYGRIWPDDEVPWGRVKDIRKSPLWERRLHCRYYARAWGCKEGHIRMVEKALNDGRCPVLLCEDDLLFEGIDLTALAGYCSRVDELGGILHFRGGDTASDVRWFGRNARCDESGIVYAKVWPGSVCIALNRDGLLFYLDGMLEHSRESDGGMCWKCQASDRAVASVLNHMSPVKWNMHFQSKSNIWGSYNPW